MRPRNVSRSLKLGLILSAGLTCNDVISGSTYREWSWAQLSVSHRPLDPTTLDTITISVTAPDPGVIVSTYITIDGNVVTTCAGGSCSFSSLLAAGPHTYGALALDADGKVVGADTARFTVWLAPSGGGGGGGGGSAISPHWRHVRTSTVDYRIHYQPDPEQSQEYAFAASHYDVVIGGNLNEYKSRNPGIRQFLYDLLWQRRQETDTGMEAWLQANGYHVEDAYLHRAGEGRTAGSRVEANQFGNDMYWYYNLRDPGFRAWRRHRTQQLLSQNAQGHRYDGFFFDVAHIEVMSKDIPFPTEEYATVSAYAADYRDLLAEQRALVPAGLNILNQAQYFNRAENMANAVASGGAMLEYVNTPYGNEKWSIVDDLVADGATVQFATGVSSTTKGQVRNDVTPGNYGSIAERVLMWEYASYLMVVDPGRMDAVLFETYGLSWSTPMSTTWLEAFEHDIGLATGPRRVLTRGTDGAGQSYTIYERDFESARVLIRPQGGRTPDGRFDYSDASAVAVPLTTGPWRTLQANGRFGPPIARVELRAGEAVILVR